MCPYEAQLQMSSCDPSARLLDDNTRAGCASRGIRRVWAEVLDGCLARNCGCFEVAGGREKRLGWGRVRCRQDGCCNKHAWVRRGRGGVSGAKAALEGSMRSPDGVGTTVSGHV